MRNVFDPKFNSRNHGHWKSCSYSTHSLPAAQIKVDALLCLLLHLKVQAKPIIFSIKLWTLPFPPTDRTEVQC